MDWRAMLDGAGPLHALLAQEKAAGASVGATVGLVPAASAAGAGGGSGGGNGGCGGGGGNGNGGGAVAAAAVGGVVHVSADDTAFDGDVEAVIASLAAWMFQGVATLRRELETRDEDGAGALTAEAFAAAVAAAGYGPDVFGPEELRWALTACHHPVAERVIVYPKYLAMIMAGIERGVYRR